MHTDKAKAFFRVFFRSKVLRLCTDRLSPQYARMRQSRASCERGNLARHDDITRKRAPPFILASLKLSSRFDRCDWQAVTP
jgi:hypothetical protein